MVVAKVKDRSPRWSAAGTTVTELELLRGTGHAFVQGINDAGTSVGTSDERAVTRDAQGKVTALPPPVGLGQADPVAINAAGSVAGDMASSSAWPVQWRAVVWR
ncbi:hypothetical protein [Streptomyces sp. NRRL F-2580]|uniref:hypothetical protein n=1 Tax=Streptomyces sp. NRRL F-2580 TaxID=1463841 RepID=UPI0004CB9CA8|nr:hypothetical protein [Streptomyces sp. NRRL F-2580]